MFKNLSVYRVDVEKAGEYNCLVWGDSDRSFEEANAPRWPEKHDLQTRGFVFPPLSVTSQTIDSTGLTLRSFLPITQVNYIKAIDAAAVNCEVERKVKKIKAEEGREVGRKEKGGIKDEIIQRLLPNAPVKQKNVQAFLTSDGYILIDATGKQAEEFLEHLRDALGSLPCRPFAEKEVDAVSLFIKNEIERHYFKDIESEGLGVTGSFCFTIGGDEKITIQNGEEETISDQLFDRINSQYSWAKWCEFRTENATFRLTDNFQLKAIKLELEYEPENEDDGQLSAAWYRFYLEFFLKLANDLRLAVGKYVHVDGSDD